MKKFLCLLVTFTVVLMMPLLEPLATQAEGNTVGITIPGPPATIVVYRKSNVMGVYDANNQLLRACFVSTGKAGHETPLGVYQIYQHTDKGWYHPMVDGTYGRWCMRFKQGGYMIHSVCYANAGDAEPIPQEVADIGTSVSRGCVRLNVTDAEWLYNATSDGCSVIVIDY